MDPQALVVEGLAAAQVQVSAVVRVVLEQVLAVMGATLEQVLAAVPPDRGQVSTLMEVQTEVQTETVE